MAIRTFLVNFTFFLIFHSILCFCGCEASDVHQDDNKRKNLIKMLGGNYSIITKSNVKKSNLPLLSEGRIGFVDLSDVDLAGLAVEDVVSYESIVIAVLNGALINNDQTMEFGYCQFLEQLYLSSTNISGSSLLPVSKLEHLKILDLNQCNITDGELIHFAKNKSLESLSLRSTHVTENGIKNFKKLRPDVSLSWSCVPSEEVRVAMIHLRRHGIGVVDASRSGQEDPKNRRRRRYSIRFPILSGSEIPPIVKQDKNISLWINAISSQGGAHLYFGSPHTGIREVFQEISSLKNINSVVIGGKLTAKNSLLDGKTSCWSDDDLIALTGFHCRVLTIAYTKQITEKGYSNLSKVDGLETLELNTVKLSNESIQAISECKTLKKIIIRNVDLANMDVSRLSSLEKIEFHNCKGLAPGKLKDLRILNPQLKISQ